MVTHDRLSSKSKQTNGDTFSRIFASFFGFDVFPGIHIFSSKDSDRNFNSMMSAKTNHHGKSFIMTP